MAYGSPIPLGQFAPDADPTTPGVLIDCDGFFPTMKGIRNLPALVVGVPDMLPEPARGSFTATFPSGDTRFFVGTTSHIYSLSPSWTEWDTGQTFAVDARWWFATFGRFVLAANGIGAPQISDSGGQFQALVNGLVFGTITTSVDFSGDSTNTAATIFNTAAIIEVVDDGVFIVGHNSQGLLFSLSATDWNVGVPNFVFASQLDKTPGPIRAFHRIRGGAVAYKDESILMGRFTGDPLTNGWDWQIISEDVGCSSQNAVVNAGDIHLFPSSDDFWMFDGSSLQPVPSMLREWFFRQLDDPARAQILGVWDRVNGLATWYYETATGSTRDTALIFNVRVRKWMKSTALGPRGPIVVADIVRPTMQAMTALTYAEFSVLFAGAGQRYSDIPATLRYNDVIFGTALEDVAAIIGADGFLYVQQDQNTCRNGFITTGEIGDGTTVQQLDRVRPLFADTQAGNGSVMQGYKRRYNGAPSTLGALAPFTNDGACNLHQTARVHQLMLNMTGPTPVEMTSLLLDVIAVGEE